MGLVYLPTFYHKKSTIPVWHGCRTQNSLGDFISKAEKNGSLCGNLQIEESEATSGHNLSVKNHWNSIAKESSSQDFREKIWGSNRFKCHEHFDSIVWDFCCHYEALDKCPSLMTSSNNQPTSTLQKGPSGSQLPPTLKLKPPLVGFNHRPESSPGVFSRTWHPLNLIAKDFPETAEAPHNSTLFESLNLPTPKCVVSRAENRLGQFFVLGNAIDGSRLILEMQLGHVCIFPHMSQTGWFSTDFKLENEWLDFTWIRILFMHSSRGLFLWMVQRRSRFWNLKRGDGTTQDFVSGAFRVCKFQSGLLAKYFILANNCSWSHTNVGQTGGDLSFRVPYLFQIHWPHGVFHQKMRSRNLQFLCSLWQLGFFLNVNFSSFKAPPALHSVAKCFAASTQHWCLWKNETSKTAGS